MKEIIRFFLMSIVLMSLVVNAKGQQKGAIKINGIVLDADSLVAVPYTAVQVKNQLRGTVCDNSGYFSVLVQKDDTLVFSGIGYKTKEFVVPELTDTDYSLIQLIRKESIVLEEVKITAWPDEAQFVKAFHELKLPRNHEDIWNDAQQDLFKVMKKQYDSDKFYYDQMRYSKLYNTTGFMPPNNFLNPINWTNFIQDWRNGIFKTKRK